MAQRARGDLDAALQSIRESVRLLEPPNGENRPGRLQPYGLALIREGQILGEVEGISLNRPAEAIAPLEHALKIGEEFARRDANDFQSQYRVYSAETRLAAILRQSNPARAAGLYDDALHRLVGANANGGTLRNEAMALAASTYPLVKLGRRAEARKRLDAAFDRLSRLKEYPAQPIETGSPAADTLVALAEYESSGGNRRRAAEIYSELLNLIASAAKPKENDFLQDAVEMSNIYARAVRAFRRAGQTAAAAAVEERRLRLWQDWDRKLPGNAFVRRQLAAARLP
jgi:hypothetical protein